MPTITGFRHAPVSKGIIFLSAGASILSQAARASRRVQLVPGLLSRALVFRSPAELLFGTLVLYYFRVLERESGSNKFGAFAAASTGISALLQWLATRSGLAVSGLPSGPYGLIFAAFVQYFFQVPASNKVVVWPGWRLSDKVFLYLVGLQLLLSGGTSSLLAGCSGLVAGLLWRANVAGLKRFRLPGFVSRFFSATLGALLGGDSAPAQQPGAAQAAAAAGQQRRGGATPGAAPGARPAAAAAAASAPGVGGGGAAAAHLPLPSPEAVEQLVAMGFGAAESERALQLANNDVNAAIGLLLNN
ncbi:hypothetical protein HYH02_014731 [Chlamydomonas schloesseri]|uniref:UBA domain-containing protein n=1 Tax=Chlamydomonas schloesseri TaxID=2026947 RepID=A0A835SJH4_9CHLO|nr:hypothetical protein HYH02_014731 [Chlamydomonas schloesseri]|eukprot:KAG2426691.1 hypothetical protein HYH02_014731 [Chlamydomonas schloesseri]